MGKVVFNIVETDYDVSKAEETYLKFRRDYKHELNISVDELQKRYGLTRHQRNSFVKRIICEDQVIRCGGNNFQTRLKKVEFC